MTARIYVGTYAKYNAGNLAGDWLDVEDYVSKDHFLEGALKLHADEEDPELMFQDYEGFPECYYSESNIDEKLWDWLELDERERDILAAYQSGVESDADWDEARDAFSGIYNSEADWAEQFLEDTGSLSEVPENLRNYIDFEAYGRDARIGGDMSFVRYNNDLYVFHNY